MSTRHDTRKNARKAAVQALYQWDITAQNADEIESRFRQIHDLHNVDQKYFKQVLQQLPPLSDEIEAAITPHIDRAFAQLDPVEKAILRLGAWELMQRDDIPVKVVLNEMIEIAKIFGADHSYKFINGVMDKLAQAQRSKQQSD